MRDGIRVLVLSIAAIVAASTAQADWRNSITQEFVAERNEKHPRTRELSLFLPVDARFGADVCFGYGNQRTDKPNRGKVAVVVEVTRQESPTGPVRLIERKRIPTEKLSGNAAGGCSSVGLLQAGDRVAFRFKFKGLPTLRPTADGPGWFQFHGNVVSRDCTEGPCVSGKP